MSRPRIDKGVPLPSKWPFEKMAVGDSFEVPPDATRNSVSVAAMRYGRRHGVKFTVRLTPERKLRCWRIE